MVEWSRNDQIQGEIRSAEQFRRTIRAAVLQAEANGVDVRGSWPVCLESEDDPDWDVEITALATHRDRTLNPP